MLQVTSPSQGNSYDINYEADICLVPYTYFIIDKNIIVSVYLELEFLLNA